MWMKFWKSEEHMRERTFLFFSSETRSVERRLSTNRARQKVFYKNFKIFDRLRTRFYQSKNKFNWSSANWGLIEPSKTKLKKFKKFSIGKKTHSIDWNSGKIEFWKTTEVLCRKHSNQLISWMKCMSMSLKVFQ